MNAKQLLSITNPEFHGVVNDDVRSQTDPETAEALRSPEVFDRWWSTLLGMSKSIDGQLGARREEFLSQVIELKEQIRTTPSETEVSVLETRLSKISANYHRGRAGSLRFKSGLDVWLVEAALIRRMRKHS